MDLKKFSIMESYIFQNRTSILFVTVVSLFLVGLAIYFSGLLLEPTVVFEFLEAELGRIYKIPKHISAFGVLSMLTSLFGIYGVLASTKFHFQFSYAILFTMSYELVIIATYLINQRIQPWYVNGEILQISGATSFHEYLSQSNFTNADKPFLIEAKNNMENVRSFHSNFECCSGYKFNKWRPLFPNYICCKTGISVPCTKENSYEDRCDQKLQIYAWKRYRIFVMICGAIFAFQTMVLGIMIYICYLELKHKDANKQK